MAIAALSLAMVPQAGWAMAPDQGAPACFSGCSSNVGLDRLPNLNQFIDDRSGNGPIQWDTLGQIIDESGTMLFDRGDGNWGMISPDGSGIVFFSDGTSETFSVPDWANQYDYF